MRRISAVVLALAALAAGFAVGRADAAPRPAAHGRALAPQQGDASYRHAATWSNVKWALTPGRYGEAVDVSSAPDGTIYVLDRRHAAVHVLDADTTPRRTFLVPGAVWPLRAQRLDVGADGAVYVLSNATGRDGGMTHLDQLAPDGQPINQIDWSDDVYDDVGVRADGRIYLARSRDSANLGRRAVDVYTPDGQLIESLRHAALDIPQKVDVAADGTIYVLQDVAVPAPPQATPGPRPTAEPSGRPAQAAPQPVPGVVIFAPDHAYMETVPFDFGLDVAVGPSGVYLARYGEVYALRAAAPLSSPIGQRWSGALALDVAADGRLFGSLSHCYFQGLLGYDDPRRPGEPWLRGRLDRPELEGPVYPVRVAADEDVLALQGSYAILDERPLQTYLTEPEERQSVQRWLADGTLDGQLGLCTAGPESGWTRDVAVTGATVYTVDGGCVEARPDEAFPAWTYCTEGTWGPGRPANVVAVAADAARVAVLDTGAGGVVLLGHDGRRQAAWLVNAGAVSGPAVDIALAGDRVYVAETGQRRLLVRGLDGADLGAIALRDAPLAVATGPGGDAFVLGRGGWAYRYAPDGTLSAAWPMPDRYAQPRDLAVDERGRVVVAWVSLGDEGFGGTSEILDAGIWVFESAPATTPLPPAVSDGCTAVPDKRAAPARVPLGNQVEVTLTLNGTCPPVPEPLQVALVFDVSRSMGWRYALRDAQLATTHLLSLLDPRSTEVALVSFGQGAALVEPLTRDLARLAQGVAGLRAGGDTQMGAGVDLAHAELIGGRRDPAARQVMVLITDGVPKDPIELPRALAGTAADRIDLVALVFESGQRASVDFQAWLAENDGDIYFDPTAAALRSLADGLVRVRPRSGWLQRVTITDEIPANMRYVAGSASPAATLAGRVLTWSLPAVGTEGLSLTYRLIPQAVGTWPTNVHADADYLDAAGRSGRQVFPVPMVDVYADVRRVYLPFLARQQCLRRLRPVDVVLVLDTSESMAAPAEDGGTKLDAARQAAGGFVALLQLPRDRAAVVSFSNAARRGAALTGDRAMLAAALAGLASTPGTRIDLGLAETQAVLAEGRRADAQAVVVLLTDGRQNGDAAPVRAEAAELKAAGVRVFTIGLGADADAALLREVASAPADYYESPAEADLAIIYAQISERLACGDD